jgi:ubiquinone biosynthesis protein UbiJ
MSAWVATAMTATLRRLWKEQGEDARQWPRLQHQVLAIRWAEWPTTYYLSLTDSPVVSVVCTKSAEAEVGLSFSALQQWQAGVPLTSLIEQGILTLEGDLELPQAWLRCLKSLQPDLEEILSQYFGDVVAHRAMYHAKSLTETVKNRHTAHQKRWGETLIEEWRLLPSELEIAYFSDQVDDLSSDFSRLLARAERLLERKTP